MTPPGRYSYAASVKSGVSDELINTWLLRPMAGVIVRMLYRTRVTPDQVTSAGIAAGLLAAFLYSRNTPGTILLGGLALTLKDLLDTADGQLARAKELYSRRGRFLDSIGDFIVNILVFAAIAADLTADLGLTAAIILAGTAFLCLTLRVSYHVFYQASYLHLQNSYQANRITEEVREEDLSGDKTALRLQRIFSILYGWQDRMMVRLDRWCGSGSIRDEEGMERWYGNRTALRISSFIGLGTELFALMLFSVTNRLIWYLVFNLVVMNGVWVLAVAYRRIIVSQGE